MKTMKVPDIPEEERTPLVVALLEANHELQEQVQRLRDEIARLKGLKPRPDIKPSKLGQASGRRGKKRKRGKRPGSAKRCKTREITIHETVVVQPAGLPEGSRFKGCEYYTVQDIKFCAHNTRFCLERWETPSGDSVRGRLPEKMAGGHFGPRLVSFVLYQYYHAHVTQPLILEQLREIGIDISAGKVNDIVTGGKEHFHAEKDEILRAGLDVSRYIHVDDTGARHQGRNGYCTHIGNELFAWFESTESKSRINFLKLLRGKHIDYIVDDAAIEYMRALKLPGAPRSKLIALGRKTYRDEVQWAAGLDALGITGERHVRIATEGALLGSVLAHGVDPGLIVMSDGAGQFNVLLHALCWIHAERTIAKLVGFGGKQQEELDKVQREIWEFYEDLKAYKAAPCEERKVELSALFEEIFDTDAYFASLNLALGRIHESKAELLLVLDHPEVPLQNNLSERDIREYVKKRKISGSTRSDQGRRCRDTFTSLKKTCRKLGISFWDYLQDRTVGSGSIPSLGELVRQKARASQNRLSCGLSPG